MQSALIPHASPTSLRGSLQTAVTLAVCGAVVALGLPSLAAVALGVAVAALVGTPAWAGPLGARLLKLAVIGLGAGLDLGEVLRAGAAGFVPTALCLVTTLALGALAARWLGVGEGVGTLVTVGTAICGGSAIAAAAPALRAKGEEVGVALGVVFTLNTAALLVFPALGRALELSPAAFARWCAIAIHDTSSVVGAAATFGPEALELATVTKLARALWIVPVVFGLGWLRSQRHTAAAAARPAPPWFVLGFVAAAACTTWWPVLAPAGAALANLAKDALLVALFTFGLGTRWASVRAIGPRPFLLGGFLWVTVSVLGLALV